MVLVLRDVVRDVVHLSGRGRCGGTEHLRDRAADGVGHRVAVREREVRGGGHRRRGTSRPSGEESGAQASCRSGSVDPVAAHRRSHQTDVVGADLVTEAARARVDQHGHHLRCEPEGSGRLGVEHGVHPLELDEVVARADRAELARAAQTRALGHRGRVGAGEAALGLRSRRGRPRCRRRARARASAAPRGAADRAPRPRGAARCASRLPPGSGARARARAAPGGHRARRRSGRARAGGRRS